MSGSLSLGMLNFLITREYARPEWKKRRRPIAPHLPDYSRLIFASETPRFAFALSPHRRIGDLDLGIDGIDRMCR